ncbi:MAG: cupin domain-containing protein, partial [Gammaproteobacteria bacterium]
GDDIMHPDIGEEILIPARVVHSVRTCGSSGSVWLYGYRLSAR